MKSTFLSRFTPSLMPPETLEAIFVQRHGLASDLVEAIRDSVLTQNKHFRLLIGMRGIGKTHMVTLVYHRISKMEDLRDKLVIAWLREEEWGITSFLDLLLRIFRALKEEYPPEYDVKLNQQVEALYELSQEEAELQAALLLRKFIGKRTLLIIAENLDDLFDGLGDIGQKQLRAYIQNYSFITILATAQSLFDGVSRYEDPFYGFFYPYYLEDLKIDDAINLLRQIAKFEGDDELETFICTPKGNSRIRAVHHLAGGNPRVYVIFSQFLTRKSLDELVEPFMRMLDDLTPYYQARMSWLSQQQRKIIEFLVERRHPVTVKEIAQRCFITHQTASSQLKDLRAKSYVISEAIGRESFYELREPLMRFCLEVKKQREEPIRLFIDFLRCWYTKEELQQRLGMEVADDFSSDNYQENLSARLIKSLHNERGALPDEAILERQYILKALETMKAEEEQDPRISAYIHEYEDCCKRNDYTAALQYARRLVEIRGGVEDWLLLGEYFYRLGYYEYSLACCDKAIKINPDSYDAWSSQGVALFYLERYEDAVTSYDKAIDIKPDGYGVWNNRGNALDLLQRYEEALLSYEKAIEIKPDEYGAWYNRGIVLENLEKYIEALASYNKAIEIKPNAYESWNNRGNVLRTLKRYEEALSSYEKAIEIKPNEYIACKNLGIVQDYLARYEEAIASYDKAIEIKPDYYDAWSHRGLAQECLDKHEDAVASYNKAIEIKPDDWYVWNNRGVSLASLQRYEEALASYNKAVEIKLNGYGAWNNRGNTLRDLKRYEEALASYNKAVEIKPDNYGVWNSRGLTLANLQRYEEALASYNKSIEIKPNFAYAWYNRGLALANLEKYEEAIISFDKAIKFNPNDKRAWEKRANVLEELKRYEEALLSLNKIIELDPHYKSAWGSRSWALINLEQYEEALISCEKAISLGENEHYVLANRAIAFAGLNRWEESLIALEDALKILDEGKQASSEDTELILRILFTSIAQTDVYKNVIESLVKLFDKYNCSTVLSQSLVRNIPVFMSEMASDEAVKMWLDVWRQLYGDLSEFQISLRLVNTAYRYRQSKGDRRVLLELPVEERNLLEEVLEISKN